MKENLRTFLALDRFTALRDAFVKHSNTLALPSISGPTALAAVILGSLPALLPLLVPSENLRFDWLSVVIGLLALLAISSRKLLGLHVLRDKMLRANLSLTHTAFALGCIPLVLIVLIFPTTLVEFQQATNQAATAAAPESQLWGKIQVILIASLWAGVTEEFIYRGMLISFLRRWRLFSQQRINDLFAITLSGLLFGLSHLAMWGPLMSLSLIGIGIGFGLAYIATGETLLALIIYHILFDALSLSVSFLVPV